MTSQISSELRLYIIIIFFIRDIRLPRFDDGKESVMNVENHVLHNSKLWFFSARSVQILFAFKIFWCILGILWFIFQLQPCDCKYISLFVQCLDYMSDLDIRRVFKDDTLLRGENERFQTSNRGERVFVRFLQGL